LLSGGFFWGERLRGPLSDFNQIRLALVPDNEGHSYWVVEFVWRNDGRPPFRVQHWRRARSFSLARPGPEGSQLSFLGDLKRVAKYLNMPCVIPKDYYVNLGLLDVGIDL
jgi:hypothetical protein